MMPQNLMTLQSPDRHTGGVGLQPMTFGEGGDKHFVHNKKD